MNPDCMPDKRNAAKAEKAWELEYEERMREGKVSYEEIYDMQKQRLKAEQRAQFARERQAMVGSLITQEGWEGAMVKEHVRGSQYVVLMPDGGEVYASHKKPRKRRAGLSEGGWKLWEDRQ